MKTFKHKTNGTIATYKDGVFKQGNIFVEIGCEPSEEFWEDITTDYEILSFISHYPNEEGTILFYDGEKCVDRTDGASPHSTINKSDCLLDEKVSIHSVKYLPTQEVFTIGDKFMYMYSDKKETVKGIIIRGGCIWLQTDLRNPTYGVTLEYAKKIKEPLFVTEDGIKIFDEKQLVWDTSDLNWGFLDTTPALDMKKVLEKSGYRKAWSEKSKAEEYLLENTPCLSLTDLYNFNGKFANKNDILVDARNLVKKRLNNGK